MRVNPLFGSMQPRPMGGAKPQMQAPAPMNFPIAGMNGASMGQMPQAGGYMPNTNPNIGQKFVGMPVPPRTGGFR